VPRGVYPGGGARLRPVRGDMRPLSGPSLSVEPMFGRERLMDFLTEFPVAVGSQCDRRGLSFKCSSITGL